MINSELVNLWISKKPIINTALNKDGDALHQYIQEAEVLLAQLPQKNKRNAHELFLSEQIFASCRQIRSAFINQYAEEIYSILTENFSRNHRLSELVYIAAERFPGLVPTRAQIKNEEQHFQAQKEGLEIDQGIFIRGLMQVPLVGIHLANTMLLPCVRALDLLTEVQSRGKIDLGSITYERRAYTAYLTFNNAHNLNAEDNRFIQDMETAVDLALLDEQVTVCVLRGGVMTHPRYCGKRVFCAGINLKDLHAGKISFIDFLLTRELGYISKIMHGLLTDSRDTSLLKTIQKPWIAVVDSFAIGGGAQVLLVCDKVIALDDAYFHFPAAQEGILPGSANFRLSRIAGNRLSRQMILSGRKIFANSTEAQWLCDEVISNSEVNASIKKSVHIFNQPAVIDNRRMLNFSEESRDRFREYMAEFAYIQVTRLYSSDVLTKLNRWSKTYAKIPEFEENTE